MEKTEEQKCYWSCSRGFTCQDLFTRTSPADQPNRCADSGLNLYHVTTKANAPVHKFELKLKKL